MRIALCSSAKFFDKLPELKEELEDKGFEVFLPSMKDYHHLKEDALAKIQYDLIRKHFRKIDKSDAILVANFKKNGIAGYIGGNTLLEMGHAFAKDIPIFLMNDIPEGLNYKEELLALQPFVIGKDWDKISFLINKEV